jgi:hypothetical protein
METHWINEPEDGEQKNSRDDLVAQVKRILEEDDRTITVEEFIPPHPGE